MADVAYAAMQFYRPSRSFATTSDAVYGLHRSDYVRDFHEAWRVWQDATLYESDPSAIVDSPSYRHLVRRIDIYAPLIIEELKKEPSLLVWVMDEGFGITPYPKSAAGDLTRMARGWIKEWARRNGSGV